MAKELFQEELPGTPEKSPEGKAALKLITANEQISEAHSLRDESEKELIELMKETGKAKLLVRGYTFILRNILAKSKISLKKDKEA